MIKYSIISLLSLFLSSLCKDQLQCYHGDLDRSKDGSDTLKIQSMSCVEKQQHNMTLVFPHHNSTTYSYNYSVHDQEGMGKEFLEVTHCLAFAKEEGNKVDFMCDHDHLCDNATNPSGTNLKVEHKGVQGTLYCCTESLCNSDDVVPEPPPPKPSTTPSCYKNKYTNNTDSSTSEIVPQPCDQPVCMTTTYYSVSGGAVTRLEYDCDRKGYCSDPTHANNCQNVTHTDGIPYKVCCCSTSNCNRPGDKVPKSSSPTLAPMPGNPNDAQNKKQSRWMFIGGIVAAAMFATLVFITVAVVIRKYRQHKAEQLSYTYTQLTADLAEPETTETDTLTASSPDDERMIIG